MGQGESAEDRGKRIVTADAKVEEDDAD